MTEAHKAKYASFIRMIDQAKQGDFQAVVIASPVVIGDDYNEIITNLGLLATAGLALSIVAP